jgi:hypothetical protein
LTTPLRADVVEGEVVLTSTDGATAVSLTPEAALETAERLRTAAESAAAGGDDGAKEAS